MGDHVQRARQEQRTNGSDNNKKRNNDDEKRHRKIETPLSITLCGPDCVYVKCEMANSDWPIRNVYEEKEEQVVLQTNQFLLHEWWLI